jgi:hypothetical protein
MTMGLRTRLSAGLRAMTETWARDLCLLYGVEPGEELSLSVRRPEATPDIVEVQVEPPKGPRRQRASSPA